MSSSSRSKRELGPGGSEPRMFALYGKRRGRKDETGETQLQLHHRTEPTTGI